MNDMKTFFAQHFPTLLMLGQVARHKMEGTFLPDILKLVISSIIASGITLFVGGYITVQVLDSKLSDMDKRVSVNRVAAETRDKEQSERITHDEDVHRYDINDLRKEFRDAIKDALK